MLDLSFTSQLLFLQLLTQPFLLLDQVQLLLLQVNDRLLCKLQPSQDLLNVSFLLPSPIISELGQFLYLGGIIMRIELSDCTNTNLPVIDTLDRGPHFSQLRVIKISHLLNLFLEPSVRIVINYQGVDCLYLTSYSFLMDRLISCSSIISCLVVFSSHCRELSLFRNLTVTVTVT